MSELSIPPGNRPEALKGDRAGQPASESTINAACVSAGRRPGRVPMKKALFNDLLAGVCRMKAIRAGVLKPGRVTKLTPDHPRAVRSRLRMELQVCAGRPSGPNELDCHLARVLPLC